MTRRIPPVVVRQAQAGDLDAVIAMRIALLESSRRNPAYRRLRRDLAEVARPLMAAQLADARCLTLIAAAGEDAIGMLRCTLSLASPLHDPPRHAYVLSVYVATRAAPARRAHGACDMRTSGACQHGAAEMRRIALSKIVSGTLPGRLLGLRLPRYCASGGSHAAASRRREAGHPGGGVGA